MSEHFEFYELDPPKEGDQPQLPPMFSSQEVLNGQSVFNKAVTAANSGDVGTVFYSFDEGILNVAITLNPEVIKSKAIQVHYLMTLGLSDTLAALVPPEIEISHIWPNLMFMNRGVIGQVLLYTSGEELNEVPSWIVTGVQIRREVECLKFHETKKTPIQTVSANQARQPIYKSSVDSNLKYSNYLLEMFNILDTNH